MTLRRLRQKMPQFEEFVNVLQVNSFLHYKVRIAAVRFFVDGDAVAKHACLVRVEKCVVAGAGLSEL